MSRRRRLGEPVEHPAVERIEALLGAAAASHPAGDWNGRARNVVTICACITSDSSPNWIIFDTDDGIGWGRLPPGLPEGQLVRAPVEAGGHADPCDVLDWLEGKLADPWVHGDGYGDMTAASALQRWVARTPPT